MEIINFQNISYQSILHNITGSFRENKITTFIGRAVLVKQHV